MPKMKTHKGTAKRFRVTGSGKIMRGKAYKSHILAKKSQKRNVLKRFERVNLLQKRGEWKEGSRGLGLKKTKPEA